MAWPSLPLVRVQFAVPATLSTIGSSLDESTDAFDEMLNSPKDDVGADATTLGLSGVTPPSEAFDLRHLAQQRKSVWVARRYITQDIEKYFTILCRKIPSNNIHAK